MPTLCDNTKRMDFEPARVTLVDEAATTLHYLSHSTGIAEDVLLSTSLTILKVLVESRNLGRRIMVTSKLLWPIKEVRVP